MGKITTKHIAIATAFLAGATVVLGFLRGQVGEITGGVSLFLIVTFLVDVDGR